MPKTQRYVRHRGYCVSSFRASMPIACDRSGDEPALLHRPARQPGKVVRKLEIRIALISRVCIRPNENNVTTSMPLSSRIMRPKGLIIQRVVP